MIRGRSFTLVCQAFIDQLERVPADISGALINFMVKANHRDIDADALINKAESYIIDSNQGQFEVGLTPSETNDLVDYTLLYYEIIVTLTDGSKISNGVEKLSLLDNVKKV